jgi:hypothetical protein
MRINASQPLISVLMYIFSGTLKVNKAIPPFPLTTENGTSLIHTLLLDILSSSAQPGGMLLLCTMYKLLECLRIPL